MESQEYESSRIRLLRRPDRVLGSLQRTQGADGPEEQSQTKRVEKGMPYHRGWSRLLFLWSSPLSTRMHEQESAGSFGNAQHPRAIAAEHCSGQAVGPDPCCHELVGQRRGGSQSQRLGIAQRARPPKSMLATILNPCRCDAVQRRRTKFQQLCGKTISVPSSHGLQGADLRRCRDRGLLHPSGDR